MFYHTDVLQRSGHEAELVLDLSYVLQNPVGEWQKYFVRKSAIIDVHDDCSLLFGQ